MNDTPEGATQKEIVGQEEAAPPVHDSSKEDVKDANASSAFVLTAASSSSSVETEPSADAPLALEASSGASAEVVSEAVTDKTAVNQTATSKDATSAKAATLVNLEWRVIGETVAGASHLRAGIPNQDAVLHVRESSVRLPIVLAISDGHGSDKCFRSHLGSRFAVRVAAELLDEVAISNLNATMPLDERAESWRASLPAEFVVRWRKLVEADLRKEAFNEAEFAKLVEADGERARVLVEANPYLAYGATVLTVLLTDTFALYLQLGDGEILNVSERGEVTMPLEKDARLMANETTSLCGTEPAADFRFALAKLERDLPALILLTTDGYANSFSTTEGFHQVGTDLLAMLREDGFAAIDRCIKGWLEEATARGSGDDCTLAVIVRMNALNKGQQ